jgi:hypothetical protein
MIGRQALHDQRYKFFRRTVRPANGYKRTQPHNIVHPIEVMLKENNYESTEKF